MAVYKPTDAFNFAQAFIKYMPISDTNVQVPLLDLAAKRLWMAAPWRWTLAELPVINLVPGQTTTTTGANLPSDFLYLESAYLYDGSKKIDVEIVANLSTSSQGAPGVPSQIAVQGSAGAIGTVVCHPYPPTGTSYSLVGLYKQQHPTITSGNQSAAGQGLPPDEWFWVYVELVLLYAFIYGDFDQRAGTTQSSGSGSAMTGQRGVVETAINEMRLAEKLPIQSPWLKQGIQAKG